MIVDELSATLAQRLRRERERRGWSLVELANRAAVSKSMISKVERAEASPTAALLGRLSGAFSMTMSSLLENEPPLPNRLVRQAEQSMWKDPATGYIRRAIRPPGVGRIEVTEITLPPRAMVAFPKEAFAFVDQQIWMRQGVLHFLEGELLHVLRRGDHLTLGAPANCAFENRQKTACVYVVMLVRSDVVPRNPG
ncbi:MAG: helix-turn-helix domain-containing protein [Candidatus Binataceae bacterium]